MRVRGGVSTAAHLAVGLGIVGVAGYAYAAVVGRAFPGPDGASQVSALLSVYLLINIIGPGIFSAMEQETSRSVSAAVVSGRSVRPAVLRAGALAGIACAALLLVVLAAWPLVLSVVLDQRPGLLVALVVAIVGSAGVYLTRGVLSGQQRFGPYAATFYVEGAVRLIPLGAYFLLGGRAPDVYALVFAVGSIVAAVAVWPVVRLPRRAASDVPAGGMGRSFALLAGATAMSQMIANLAPVIVTYRLPGDAVLASVFGATFVLARVPLFLFTPVLAVILPRMTRDVVRQRLDLVGRLLTRTVAALLLVGGVGVVLGALVGPWAVQVLFNSVERPSGLVVAALGAATVLLMLALVLQPALVAMGRQASVIRGWAAGSVVFLALLVAPLDPLVAALLAQLLGPLVVAVFLSVSVRRALVPAADTATRPSRETTPR